jgi:hypothetical protein
MLLYGIKLFSLFRVDFYGAYCEIELIPLELELRGSLFLSL